ICPALSDLTTPTPFFFFRATPTPAISPLSLHDALPICRGRDPHRRPHRPAFARRAGLASLRSERRGPLREDGAQRHRVRPDGRRSEEHTSELQSLAYLVCRLLLEKKKTTASCAILY